MSKEMTLIVLGMLTGILPFLGFPESWKAVFFVCMGLGIAVIGFILRAQAVSRGDRPAAQTFMESNPRRGMDDIRQGYEQQDEGRT